MGKIGMVLVALTTGCFFQKGKAQAAEAEQLLLNFEKLTQLKALLENLYDGYTILEKGYGAVRDLSEGNFSLHQAFLDGLLQVSPAVKNYYRVADIISCQLRTVKEYRAAFTQFKEAGTFTPEEMVYLESVYARLLRRSAEGLDELALVLTAGELRMSDDQRLGAIDRIYAELADQYAFLRDFNSRTALLSRQRLGEKTQIDLSRKLQGY
jgi:hypothetical protein